MGSPRLGVLNGLRGVAFLAVLYHHLVSGFTPPGWQALSVGGHPVPLWAFLSNGYTGVHLFFMLSGLVLYLPYAAGKRTLDTRGDLAEFYRRRFFRLMPLYYFSVLVAMLFFAKPSADGAGALEIVRMATVTFPFTTSLWSPRFNWVLWSLGIEIWFSVLFPLLIVAARRIGVARLLAVAVLLSLGARFAGALLPVFDVGNVYLDAMSDSVLGRLDDFVVGMLIAELYVERAWLEQRSAALLLGGALVVLWLGCAARDLRVLGELPRVVMPLSNLVLDGGFFLLICGALRASDPLRRLFDNAPLQVIGMMCYSLYIWHGLVMLTVLRGHFDVPHLALYFLLFPAISLFTYRYVEFGQEREWRRLFSASR